MARASPIDADLYVAMKSGTLSSISSGEWVPMPGGRAVNVWVSGTFVASWQLQASYDGGVTALPVALAGLRLVSATVTNIAMAGSSF